MNMDEHQLRTPLSYLLRVVTMKLKNKLDRNLASYGLSAEQGHTLDYIATHGGLIQKDISRFFNKQDATVTSMLQGLERRGLVERRIFKGNEREKRVYVTPEGQELCDTFDQRFMAVEEEIHRNLTEEEAETLKRLLIKLNDGIV